jgi:pimeloyl-ACP methyl ester carboxylesterase
MNINYIDKGSGAPIVLLHGWGGSSKSLEQLAEHLVLGGYRTINVDLPGFGQSEMPTSVIGMEEYVDLVYDLITRLELRKPVIIGHSFGGKIAMFFALKYPSTVARIVLINASGIRPKPTMRGKISYVLAKIGNVVFWIPPFIFFRKGMKHAFYRFVVGEQDYFRSQNLRETFKRVIKQHINSRLKEINLETLVIWGAEDRMTPLWQGEKIASGIKKSRLEVVDGVGHNLPLKHPEIVSQLILKFLD